ncbi:hypothetical protein MKW98_020822 [Papaver atlanticum]|uniref:PSD13 N-terminal domain-containing protein n=1 Tax=Papaver atlanticum TaxID=357466 RepID=A0AAD4TII5_9MAGN|nr:hypothetical protein MKW98_020822 [Papaver atlanticum]
MFSVVHNHGLNSIAFLSLSLFQAGDTSRQLYHNFITEFETKINLLKLAHFAVIGIIEKLRATRETRVEESILYIKMQIAACRLEMGDMTDIDLSLDASNYWLSSQYHKSGQVFAEYYNSGLLYLTHILQWSPSDLAFDCSLAPLLGDNIYNFGSCSHTQYFLGTKVEWIYYILQAFNSVVHKAALSAQPALVQNKNKLLEKINILRLMVIIFGRIADDQTIPLGVIAEHTILSMEDVELLLMKSLPVSSLIFIDGKAQSVPKRCYPETPKL